MHAFRLNCDVRKTHRTLINHAPLLSQGFWCIEVDVVVCVAPFLPRAAELLQIVEECPD